MGTTPRVFLSYSHDSDAHRERVLALSERLRCDGIATILDRYVNGTPPEGWPRWMQNRLDESDRVLLICTPTYYPKPTTTTAACRNSKTPRPPPQAGRIDRHHPCTEKSLASPR